MNNNNKKFRNIQEQVEKNQEDILYIKQSLGGALPQPIQGPQGVQGPQGERGPRGDTGPAIYTCGATLPSARSYKLGDLMLVCAGSDRGTIFKNEAYRWNPACNILGQQGPIGPNGTDVYANPVEDATLTLSKIEIDGIVYNVVGSGQSDVTSVNEMTGDVVLTASDINASNLQSVQQNLERLDERIDTVIEDNLEGSDYISVDLNPSHTKYRVELDETKLDDVVTEDSDNLVTSGAVFDAISNIPSPSVDVAWGEITGTLANQTDLNKELSDIKASIVGKTTSYILSYQDTSLVDSDSVTYFKMDGTELTYAEAVSYVSGCTNGNASFNSQNQTVTMLNLVSPLYFIFRKTGTFEYYIVVPDDIQNAKLKVGDIIYVIQLDVPDRWIGNYGSAEKLETSKIDFTSVSSNIIPTTDRTYDLGSGASYWKNIYAGGTCFLNNVETYGTFKSNTIEPVTGYDIYIGSSVGTINCRSFFKPSANYTYDLGAQGNAWNTAYVKTISDGNVSKNVASIISGGANYITTAPLGDNTDGLIFVVLDSEPTTKYNGYIYLIKE